MNAEISACVLVIMTKNRVKVAVSLSPCVRRSCAKSINKENSPHIIRAPTLHSHIHRLFTAEIFIRLCTLQSTENTQYTRGAQYVFVAALNPLFCSLISPN
ncbi:hypothetical protein AMECASPLE_013299 [Ameca splendens]|uniref:Uncharacterized protein n=1 Tax=Ameca splendens TaxID=208324 RepID=A0ABV0Z0Q9_9TELE